jgi:hypothetical protein
MKIESRNSPERERALKAFESAGLHSKSMSRKNEAEDRHADTLKMIFRDDARKHPNISEAELLTKFHKEHVVTVFRFIGREKNACVPRAVALETYDEDYDSYNPEKIAEYVKKTIEPYLSK